ncbi:hypothetical protein EUGRSUZ_B00962 [Eucalyptus grandis]|uniref:RecA family profile 1 domain-containing protein n=2 Tax=Eucalyptus grandis TaxID=71139 RepID=A0A059D0Z2_EUCGR|nr:hypothetical protein EUGRSUZ_B00962 [Eucalyptus grandis]
MRGGNGKYTCSRPDRIVPVAKRFGMDPGAVLDNIIYARPSTSEHQDNLVLGLAAKMSEKPFKLLIVDSVIALFQVDFTGRELAERKVDPETIKSCKLLFCSLSGLTLTNSGLQQKLAQMLSLLIKIAEESNVAVFMTNQVLADPRGGVSSDLMKLAGRHVLARAATISLMFRKVRGKQACLRDAPNLPEAEAIYFLRQIFL